MGTAIGAALHTRATVVVSLALLNTTSNLVWSQWRTGARPHKLYTNHSGTLANIQMNTKLFK